MSKENTHYLSAMKLYKAGNYLKAIEEFDLAIVEEPDNADLFSERGVAFYHLGNLKKSLDDMNSSQELEPNNPYRYSSRAYIRDAMGDTMGAVEDYRLAIKLDPDDAIAHNNLGMLEEKLGHKKQADALFNFADRLAQDQNLLEEKHSAGEPPAAEGQQKGKAFEKNEPTVGSEIKKVFTTRKGLAEFLKFIRNGFK